MSKDDIVIEHKLNFLRSVDFLKPVDRAKGVAMGLLVHRSTDDDAQAITTQLTRGSETGVEAMKYPVLFNISKEKSDKMTKDYLKKEEILNDIAEIENIVNVHQQHRDQVRVIQYRIYWQHQVSLLFPSIKE